MHFSGSYMAFNGLESFLMWFGEWFFNQTGTFLGDEKNASPSGSLLGRLNNGDFQPKWAAFAPFFLLLMQLGCPPKPKL